MSERKAPLFTFFGAKAVSTFYCSIKSKTPFRTFRWTVWIRPLNKTYLDLVFITLKDSTVSVCSLLAGDYRKYLYIVAAFTSESKTFVLAPKIPLFANEQQNHGKFKNCLLNSTTCSVKIRLPKNGHFLRQWSLTWFLNLCLSSFTVRYLKCYSNWYVDPHRFWQAINSIWPEPTGTKLNYTLFSAGK